MTTTISIQSEQMLICEYDTINIKSHRSANDTQRMEEIREQLGFSHEQIVAKASGITFPPRVSEK